MANSRFEYVRYMETECTILDNSWIVVQIERRSSSEKVDDVHLLEFVAYKVMKAFRDVILAFGGKYKYSFVLRRNANIHNRRAAKISSCLISTFSAFYVTQWKAWISNPVNAVRPIFYASTYIIPADDMLKNYLCHCQLELKGSCPLIDGTMFLRKRVHLPNGKVREHILPFSVDSNSEDAWQQHASVFSDVQPDNFDVDMSILSTLISEYPGLKYGDDFDFYKLWMHYQSATEDHAARKCQASHGNASLPIDWSENEIDDVVADGEWIVVRIDGRGFHKFSAKNNFEKPNDEEALNLMNYAAAKTMSTVQDIVLSFGQSDEYSFVFAKNTTFCHRRASKIESIVNSVFTAEYIMHWNKWMIDRPLNGLPTFDARTVPYATDLLLRDYLSWRQADVHINNLYNTCFWNLVCVNRMQNSAAEEYLRVHGKYSNDKRQLLLTMFNIDYQKLPEMYKLGTILIWKHVMGDRRAIVPFHCDLIGDQFWVDHEEILSGGAPRIEEIFVNEPLPRLCRELLEERDVECDRSDDGVVAISNCTIRGLLCRYPEWSFNHSFVPGCWTIIHVSGSSFREFTTSHAFERPNDDRGLNLMCHAAISLMKEHNDLTLAYAHSDEVILVHRSNAELKQSTNASLASRFNEQFLQLYRAHWTHWFCDNKMHKNPDFRTSVRHYATVAEIRDQLIREQQLAHEKNLYNTVFWNVVLAENVCDIDAFAAELLTTSEADKNERLFQEFKINYNNVPVRHKKGTILLRKHTEVNGKQHLLVAPYHRDMKQVFIEQSAIFETSVSNSPVENELSSFGSHKLFDVQI